MGYTIEKLNRTAQQYGWEVKRITYADGTAGGLVATRNDAAITVTVNRFGRIMDVKNTRYPFVRVMADRAGVVTDWLREELEVPAR